MVVKTISVIMSVYNDENNVANAIQSILDQTFDDFEFLIIDDCSTDNTYEEMTKFLNDSRVKLYVNEENIGLTKSLNKLIEESSGKYIFRQDSDDISFNNRLDEQIKILETKDVKTCTTRAIDINNNKIIPGLSSWIPKKITMKFKNPYIHGTLAIEKLLLNSIGNYSEDFYYSQDFRLYLDLLQKNEKIYEIKKPLYKLNTSNNISTLNKDEQKYYFKKALNKK
jgi:glycosyltransferase involved in cell wall biosynthesis|tara:strand:+ start:418 stop:1092 length:675 start_codon:yes stop_codon:yes gene_type:complete